VNPTTLASIGVDKNLARAGPAIAAAFVQPFSKGTPGFC
jgi:hypothetical protein